MRSLFSNSQKRQLKIIELLHHSERLYTYNQLEKQIQASLPSLKEDLNFIEKTFSDQMRLHLTNSGVMARFKNNISYEFFYQYYIAHSTPFQLIEQIFYQPNLTIEEAAKHFEVSVSTVYRLINQINKLTKAKYQIMLKTKPIHFEGNELDIRYFFAEYFKQKTSPLDWPFDHVPQPLMLEFVQIPFSYIEPSQSFASFRNFLLETTVNLFRIQQGYNSQLSTVDQKKINACSLILSDTHFLTIKQDVEQFFAIRIDAIQIYQIFFNYLHENFALSTMDLMETPDHHRSFQLLRQMIHSLCDEFNITTENSRDLIIYLHNLVHSENFHIGNQPLLINRNQSFSQMARFLQPAFYDRIKSMLDHYLAEMNIQISENGKEFMIVCIYTQWKELYDYLKAYIRQPKLMILSDFNTGHEKLVEAFIKDHFKSNIKILHHSKIDLSYEDIKKSEADIIISNFTIREIPGKEIIHFSALPNISTLKKIEEAVFRFRLKIQSDDTIWSQN